jgi:hypothetical protein
MKRREAEKKMNETNMFVTEGKSEVILSNQILDFLQERDLITSINAQKVHKELTAFIKNKIESDNNANEIEEAAPAKAKDLGISEKGYFKVKFPAGTREEAIKSIESLLKSDQVKYPGLKVDIMPLKKEEDKDFAVIKLNGEGAHTVGLKMKAAYKDKAGFKGATIKPYHPTFQSK